MCDATSLAYAAIAAATAGGAVASSDQQRRASHQAADAAKANTTVAPTAEAYSNPEADPNALLPVTRQRLKVDLNSSLVPKRAGAGLQVPSSYAAPNASGVTMTQLGVRG